MRRTLLASGLLLSSFGCADIASPDDDENQVLAAEGPWLDDPLSTPRPGAKPDASADDVTSADLPATPDAGRGPWLDPQLPPRAAAPSTPSTGARFDFERDVEGWGHSGAPIRQVARSTAQRASGGASLEVQIDGAGTALASVPRPTLRAGATVSFRVFVPAGTRLRWLQPFVQQDASGGWAWTGSFQAASSLRADTWHTLTVRVPSDARAFSALGVQLETEGNVRGRIYIDDVRF
ncbi:MAG: hypothetical protein ABW252_11680 [Polyangiales bacterium]